MTSTTRSTEGTIDFRGYRTWYRVAGDLAEPDRRPLVLIHGGPGAPHDYFEPLEALADRGRAVVLYDQLGCGASDHPHDPALWTVELFVEELWALRHELGLERCHLLGQSWGGLLALEHALAHGDGVESLTLADPLVSSLEWAKEAARLRGLLPAEVRAALKRHEDDGSTNDPEYEAATLEYYRRHVCRQDPWPDCLQRSFTKLMEDPEVYLTMWGPSEFRVTGTLAAWDVRERLSGILAPALVVGGRHDECTPLIREDLHGRLPGSRWVVFEESSHMPHLEETAKFLDVLEDFLADVEAGRG
jgi:proline-specific peptidase